MNLLFFIFSELYCILYNSEKRGILIENYESLSATPYLVCYLPIYDTYLVYLLYTLPIYAIYCILSSLPIYSTYLRYLSTLPTTLSYNLHWNTDITHHWTDDMYPTFIGTTRFQRDTGTTRAIFILPVR